MPPWKSMTQLWLRPCPCPGGAFNKVLTGLHADLMGRVFKFSKGNTLKWQCWNGLKWKYRQCQHWKSLPMEIWLTSARNGEKKSNGSILPEVSHGRNIAMVCFTCLLGTIGSETQSQPGSKMVWKRSSLREPSLWSARHGEIAEEVCSHLDSSGRGSAKSTSTCCTVTTLPS